MANLPSGYTQLEYIESTGAQYINSGYTPAWNTDVYMEAMIFKTTDFFALFGARNSSAGTDPNSNTLFISPQLNPRSDYYGSSYTFPNQLPVGVKFAVSVEQNLCDVYQYTYTHPKSTAASEYPLFVMDVNTAGSARGTGHCRLYSCSIYEGGIKIRDFIPCIDTSGKIGAYDAVYGIFYGNSGTGSFIAGPEVLPPDTPENFYQSTSVVLNWSAVECDGYKLYKNGNLIATTQLTQYVDSSVKDGQDIEYSITAYRGNLESASQTIQVSVREGYTILTPVITSAFFQ